MIIAVSEATKKDLVKVMKVSPKRIKVIHEAVDQKIFRKQPESKINLVRKKYGLAKDYFIYVGTIQPRKNLVRLIEAFSKMPSKKYDLVLAGKPGWLYDEIYQAPKKFGVEERVKFLGFVDTEDLTSLYSGALSFVFPSLYEGFGLPILEAMACRLPVLTSNTSSMPEVSGSRAILVDPKNVEDIAKGLNLLSRNEKLRTELANKGWEWSKSFSWEKTARETLKVLEEARKIKHER
jgi:glycosyltransferase involved in cell wall biosynthesis